MSERRWNLEITVAGGELAVDPTLQTDDATVLLGSSLRGVLRKTAWRFGQARGEPCEGYDETGRVAPGCGCVVCRLFGAPDRPGKLSVRSALLPHSTHPLRTVSQVGIDRTTRTARRGGTTADGGRTGGHLATSVRLAVDDERGVTFGLDATDLSEEEGRFLDELWAWCELTGLVLGRRSSTGVGWVRVVARPSSSGDDRPAARTSPPEGPSLGERTVAVLRFEALEPWRLAGLVQRDAFRPVERRVPSSTIRGALGWAVARQLGGEFADDLFIERPIRLGPGWLGSPGAPDAAAADGGLADPTHWLGLSRCRGADAHLVDVAGAEIRAGLDDMPTSLSCPTCGAPLKPVGSGDWSPMVISQTAVDPHLRRAADGALRHQATVPPGTVANAVVAGTIDQLEVLASITEVVVGGNRMRGLGRARVSLHPLSDEHQWSDPWTPQTVSAANGDAPVVTLGFAGDAFVPISVTDTFSEAGLELVAASVRVRARGGWDTLTGRPRPVRRLIQAGSWLAVTVPDRSGGGLGKRVAAAVDRLEAATVSSSADPDPDAVWFLPRRW
jgi:hypothetical protein